MPDGSLFTELLHRVREGSTGKRLSSQEKAKLKKECEKEVRKRKREKKRGK
jgi:hypothetical protein